MSGMSSSDGRDPWRRLDGPILTSNLVSGALWLFLMTPPWSDSFGGLGLFLIGAGYVLVGSVFLAAVYAREALSRRQELLAWLAPWFVACFLWSDILSGIGPDDGGSWVSAIAGAAGLGLLVGTPCYLAWQIVALVIRQLSAWRTGRSTLPTEADGSCAEPRLDA